MRLRCSLILTEKQRPIQNTGRYNSSYITEFPKLHFSFLYQCQFQIIFLCLFLCFYFFTEYDYFNCICLSFQLTNLLDFFHDLKHMIENICLSF